MVPVRPDNDQKLVGILEKEGIFLGVAVKEKVEPKPVKKPGSSTQKKVVGVKKREEPIEEKDEEDEVPLLKLKKRKVTEVNPSIPVPEV